jgi:hypothetical protein
MYDEVFLFPNSENAIQYSSMAGIYEAKNDIKYNSNFTMFLRGGE